jgi:hypothetical protein
MQFEPIASTPSAYAYPLLIKQLLHSALATAASRRSSIAISTAAPIASFSNVFPGWPMRFPDSASARATRWR